MCLKFLTSLIHFPLQGDLEPDVATNALTIFEGKFSRLKEDRDNVAKAKEALELQEMGKFLQIRQNLSDTIYTIYVFSACFEILNQIYDSLCVYCMHT